MTVLRYTKEIDEIYNRVSSDRDSIIAGTPDAGPAEQKALEDRDAVFGRNTHRNLEDITLHSVLKEADIIAAEDTRQTLKLLNHYEIKTGS